MFSSTYLNLKFRRVLQELIKEQKAATELIRHQKPLFSITLLYPKASFHPSLLSLVSFAVSRTFLFGKCETGNRETNGSYQLAATYAYGTSYNGVQ